MQTNRCLYHNSIEAFVKGSRNDVFSDLCDNYHGTELTTTRASATSPRNYTLMYI